MDQIRKGQRNWLLILVVTCVVLLIASRYLAGTWLDYQWWQEMRQMDTWLNLLLYGTTPVLVVFLVLCSLFWVALRLGLRRPVETPFFGILNRHLVIQLASFALAVLAFLVANATVDNWTVVRFLGGLRIASAPTEYTDPIFHRPLHFYFFELPFARMFLSLLVTATVLTLIIYAIAAHAERILTVRQFSPSNRQFDFDEIHWRDLINSLFIRLGVALLLIGFAVKIYLDRFGLLLTDHGQFLLGVDWLSDHIVLPLMWALVAVFAAGALLVLLKRYVIAAILIGVVLVVRFLVPGVVSSVYVRPNELALEKPYIQHHINATRAAFGLGTGITETAVPAEAQIPLNYERHKALLDNVRLWDWRAFHDTISQIQPLRPYIYQGTDVDRYNINGNIRQVLIAPRELEISQLGAAANRWINPHLIYTHGYGVVMAEANRITSDGLPVLLIKDAPPVSSVPSLQNTQPDLYYSEIAHEPVFVDTSQQEFDYPSGGDTIGITYKGSGGFNVGSPLTRFAAAVAYGDMNILLTEYLHANSRMMIHRPILERLHKLAGFLTWDMDPYIVLRPDGHLMWIVDGYMTSDAHPYSREVELGDQSVNYIRNSIKATVDAFTGEVHLYNFNQADVLIQAYSRLFPHLIEPANRMPADIRQHVRYPETLFRTQAEIYRAFHMRDPEAFYNRADFWDLAKTSSRADQGATYVSPTYVVATLPNSDKPEFMLITTFTPANKDNLIGVMYARCDGDHLGELVFTQLAKQTIIYGPMQIDARVNQDQTISKDLSLWNQQGSTVLRGQTLVLPIDNSFLYVEPIYIQAQQASMPQLKKVAIAMGNLLAYADTYEQALQEIINQTGAQSEPSTPAPTTPTSALASSNPTALPATQNGAAEQKLHDIQSHLQRYRDLSAQGKWSEAGKELDAIQQIVNGAPR